MNLHLRSRGMKALVAACGLMGLMVAATGCVSRGAAQNESENSSASWAAPVFEIPAGTPIEVRLSSTLSSKDDRVGSRWTGLTTQPVTIDGEIVLATGSLVEGTVVGSIPASKGARALLDLRVNRVDTHNLRASTEPVIAGSPRARNLGAIASGTAAGALIGKAVGGDGKDAAVGGLIGGAVATGAVAASKGYQVVLKEGTVMTFTTDTEVAVR